MNENTFIENLEKSVNHIGMNSTNINEFGKTYDETIRLNKLQSLIEIINIEKGEEGLEKMNNKEIVEIPSDNIFFKELREKVKTVEETIESGSNL